MNVKLYIGENPNEEEMTFRYFRNVQNPEAYKDYRIGEKIVVNGMKVPEKIIGEITEIINDPDHDSRDIFVKLTHENFETAVSTGTWNLIETP